MIINPNNIIPIVIPTFQEWELDFGHCERITELEFEYRLKSSDNKNLYYLISVGETNYLLPFSQSSKSPGTISNNG